MSKNVLLKGVRVLDFSRILVGSFASMMLADLGAEVIKIESESGDETRSWGPPFVDNNSTYFMSLNRNKKSVSIDFKHKSSQAVTERLIRKSDIFIENFPANKLDKFKLDYNSVKDFNSKIIYASVNGYGHAGEMKATPAFDFITQAYTGIMGITGEKDKSYRVGFPICDILTSQSLYSAILAALLHKNLHNEGQLIQTSLLEASLFCNPTIVSAYLNGNSNSSLKGNDHPNIAPYTVFSVISKTDDGKELPISIAIGVALDSQFKNFKSVIGLEDPEEKYVTNQMRVKNRDSLKAEIQAKITEFIRINGEDALYAKFEKFGIPFSKINSMKEIFSKKQVDDIKLVESAKGRHEDSKDLKFVRHPVNYEKIQTSKLCRPPNLGEHTRQVLSDIGQFNDKEIDDLISSKCVFENI